jgi:hypothetical protein
MHSYIRELGILSEMSTRKREEIIRHAIQAGYKRLETKEQNLIQEAVESVKIQCVDTGMGDAAVMELFAKLGMFLRSQE